MGTRKPQGVVPVEALGQGDLFSCSSNHAGTADALNIKPFDSLEGAGADIKGKSAKCTGVTGKTESCEMWRSLVTTAGRAACPVTYPGPQDPGPCRLGLGKPRWLGHRADGLP